MSAQTSLVAKGFTHEKYSKKINIQSNIQAF